MITRHSFHLNFFVLSIFLMLNSYSIFAQKTSSKRWTEQQANEWYSKLPWLSGCDYIPATSINQIEMWSKNTYDAKQIDKELGWAEGLGFNTMRVFLSSVVYKNDPIGLKNRIKNFLNICQKHGIRPLFVFFDDCWNAESSYGKQLQPKIGIHNSGWVQDPSVSLRSDTTQLYKDLSKYVKDIIKTFANDDRILMWDLYNEPGNSNHNTNSLPLLKKVFKWARSVKPSQPLTSGIWNASPDFAPLNAFQLNKSDVISYHNYKDKEHHTTEIEYLRMLNRPLICTEYMARTRNSLFKDILPLLKENKVVAINWGFVSGKTNTIYAWDSPMPNGGEPKVWFHDIFRMDGTPFSKEEINIIKTIHGK